MKARSGFSLIELLVVIGVVAILAAIIYPILSTIKEKGRQTSCLSNLKQLGTGMKLYADDWNNHFPTARLDNGGKGNPFGNWAGVYEIFGECDPQKGQIYQYVRNVNVYLCRSDRGIRAEQIRYADPLSYPLSYSMNNIADYRASSTMDGRSKVGLLIHEERERIDDGDFYWFGWTDGRGGRNRPTKIHNGGTCVLYCDLHAEWKEYGMVIQALRNGEWDPLGIKR